MSLDYFANHSNFKIYNNNLTYSDVFLTRIATNNPDNYPTGKTGYEAYYTDIQGFWRELYNPKLTETLKIENNVAYSDYYWSAEALS
jgi:hypothetical protein